MRAARRMIVLAGILALAVCAPITWTQAGAQSDSGGESPPEITFVKIMCADFGAIPANTDEPNGLSARPEGTTLGPPIEGERVDPNETAAGCERIADWPFVLGSDADVVRDPHGTGNMVDPSLPSVTGTVALTPEQLTLLSEGGLRVSEVAQDGFAFGTFRCGTDNRNDDNLEFLGITPDDPLVCVAYNVGAPVTITKTVQGTFDGESQFSFEVTCGDGESTSYDKTFDLSADGSTNLWLPYGADCHLIETNTGGADDVTFAVNGKSASASEGSQSGPTLAFTTPGIVDNKVDPTTIEVTNAHERADLELTKAANPNSVAQGSPVSFDLTVTNLGPDSASGVALTDALPTGVTWTIANAPEDVSDPASPCSLETGEGSSAQTLRCDVGSLDSDGTFSVTVTSSATTTCGTITNQDAAVTADTQDPNSDNNIASASVGVKCPPPPPPPPPQQPTPFIQAQPTDDTSTTTTSTTTTTTLPPAPEEAPPAPTLPPPPPPEPTVLATVVVRTFIPPELPPPSELPPPPVSIAPRPKTKAAPPPPPEVVLKTINPSATPGGVLGVTGQGCDPNAKVEFSIDGAVVGETTAKADGTFEATVNLPVLDIGRSVLHADCGGSTDTNFDVVLTTSSMPAGSLGMGVLFLAILAVIAFAHPLAASKKG
jgi:uncharacterized repeat protein (TIGR01451 family)